MNAPHPGQIPCPSCSRPLVLPVTAVLTGEPIVCAGCGLELTTQRDASREALAALDRWHRDTTAARTAAVSGQPPEQAPRPSRRARRPRR